MSQSIETIPSLTLCLYNLTGNIPGMFSSKKIEIDNETSQTESNHQVVKALPELYK